MPSLKAITIQEIDLFNTRLLSKFSKLSIAQYFKLVNDEFYKSNDASTKASSSNGDTTKNSKDSDRPLSRAGDQNLEGNNIDFTDHFLRLVETPLDFCVSHEDFYKYGVLSNNKGTTHVLKLLKHTHDFEEGIDFQLVNEVVNDGKRGHNKKKTYIMTPDVFKICLMRCKNTNIYANHYLKLERIYVYYQRYEKAYLNHIINGKDDKIDELKADLKEQARLAEIERQESEKFRLEAQERDLEARERDRLNNEKFNELLRRTGATLDEIGEIKDICKDTDLQLGEIVDVVDTISTNIQKVCSTDVRGALADVEEKTEFILIQHETNLNAFKFLRGKKAYNDNKLKKTYSNYKVVKRDYDANPMTLFNSIKSRV
jgi:hypothetical protein